MRKSKIADEIIKLEKKNGTLTPAMVVDAARDPESPLHASFEWDDRVAAVEYRLIQAAELIRSVRVEIEEIGPVQKYVSIQKEPSTYHNVEKLTAARGKEVVRLELQRIMGGIVRARELSAFNRMSSVEDAIECAAVKISEAIELL